MDRPASDLTQRIASLKTGVRLHLVVIPRLTKSEAPQFAVQKITQDNGCVYWQCEIKASSEFIGLCAAIWQEIYGIRELVRTEVKDG